MLHLALARENPPMNRLLLLCTCLLVFIAACDEDDDGPRETIFAGNLVLALDETPMAGLEVTLFEPETQVAVAQDVSDSNGEFEFAGIPEGSYVPVVHANGYRPILMARPRWPIARGERVHVEIRMRESARISQTPYSLTGRVVDNVTREPIPNARIEMNFAGAGELAQVNWSEYDGWSTTLEATSDADGMFFIQPCPLIEFSVSSVRYIPGYRVTAPGYQSRRMDRNYEPESISSIVQGVRLTPGEDLGTIEGRVLDRFGQPLEGVPVSVEWRRGDEALREFEPVLNHGSPDDILIPDGVARSDADGLYRVTGLPQGFYNVQAGIYPDDGWTGLRVGGVEIPGFSATATADVVAYPVVRIVEPAEGAELDGTPARFSFEEYPEATKYEILVRRDFDGLSALLPSQTGTLEINPDMGFFQQDGTYAWQVLARDASSTAIGLTDRAHAFRIVRPAD
jgi:hypothetical protein